MMETDDPIHFNAALRTLGDVSACRTHFEQAIRPFGFSVFACGEVDLNHRERNALYVLNWPSEWLKLYLELGMIENDPLLEALSRQHTSFLFSEVRAQSGPLSAGARRILAMSNKYAWSDGFVVPLPHGGHRFGLTTMVGGPRSLSQRDRDYLTLIATCFYVVAREMVRSAGFAVSPANLTVREIGCIRLVARGLADAELAVQMGISRWTAHGHVEAAKRKLKARSRAEMIAIATFIGIVNGV